jgi:hypothetical protein
MSTSQAHRRETASHLTEQLIKLAGAKPADRVTIVGRGQIELLIAFAGRGFVEVTCCAAMGGPNAEEASADLAVALAVHSEAELLAILSRLRRSLRPGGALLLGTADPRLATWKRRRPELLARYGFVLLRKHIQSPGVDILCCRKLSTRPAAEHRPCRYERGQDQIDRGHRGERKALSSGAVGPTILMLGSLASVRVVFPQHAALR